MCRLKKKVCMPTGHPQGNIKQSYGKQSFYSSSNTTKKFNSYIFKVKKVDKRAY